MDELFQIVFCTTVQFLHAKHFFEFASLYGLYRHLSSYVETFSGAASSQKDCGNSLRNYLILK